MTIAMASPDLREAIEVEPEAAQLLKGVTGSLIEAIPLRLIQLLGDDDLLKTTEAIEHLGRFVDALRIRAAAEIDSRSAGLQSSAEGLAKRKGCRNATELVERLTRVSGKTAAFRIRLGQRATSAWPEFGSGSAASFRHLAEAIETGQIGLDSASAILSGIEPILKRGTLDGILAAEIELVAAATGRSDLVPTACTADEIRQQSMVWQVFLDPDGIEPIERRAWESREFELGRQVGGLVRGRFALMPEVAAKLNRLFDAYMSPRSGAEFRTQEELAEDQAQEDPRSRGQQRHDVLASMIDHYSRSGVPPRIGGAPPTVLVTVRESDLESGHGPGFIDGLKSPVSSRTIRHLACNGGYQFVSIDSSGAIRGLGSAERCFTPAQRRAITARDGGCVIPGCTIPAAWCEIHHVNPAQNGGPTHTDNGVLLCWSHHRTIDTSGWEIKMIRGAPYVKPPNWIRGDSSWRRAQGSPVAMLDSLESRLERSG